jgi:hypothetical protein
MRQPGKGAQRHAVALVPTVGFACRGCTFHTGRGDLSGAIQHAVSNQFTVVEEWPPRLGPSVGKEDGARG